MIKLVIVFLFLCSGAVYAKKIKIPKNKLIDEFHLIAEKNIKKTKKDVQSVLSFRSTDFDGQYYIGGNAQLYFERIIKKMLMVLDEAKPGLLSEDLKNNIGFYVIYSPSLNAHSTRNNNILLTSQWIIEAETEAEVSSVIAHELAHLILNHPDTNVDRFLQTANLKKFTNIASTIKFVSDLKVSTSGEKLDVNMTDSGTKDLAMALMVGKMMVTAKKELINPKISRKNESEADFFAVDLIYITGYPLVASQDMFKILDAAEKGNEKKIELSQGYIKNMQPVLNNWIVNEIDNSSRKNVFKSILTNFLIQKTTVFAQKVTHWFNEKKRNHLRAHKRREKVELYISTYYSEDDGPPSETNEGFEKIKNEIQEIDHLFEELAESDILIDEGKLREADNIISKIHTKTSTHTDHPVDMMKWIVWSKLQISQKNHEKAVENICKYVWGVDKNKCISAELTHLNAGNSQLIPLDSFVFLAEAYIHLDQYENSRLIIDKGKKYYKDDSPFQVHNIIMSCNERAYTQFESGLRKCKKNASLSINEHCQTIEKKLELMVKLEQEKDDGIFARVQASDLPWWESCQSIPIPFSSVTKHSKVINKNILERLQRMKK